MVPSAPRDVHALGLPRDCHLQTGTAARRALSRSASGTRSSSPTERMTARSTTFCSSRMFPGHAAPQRVHHRRRRCANAAPCAEQPAARNARPAAGCPPALAQRRHLDRENVEAVVEIGAERSFGDHRPQIAVRGGDDAARRRARSARAADALELALLQDAQQLRLQLSGISPISSRKSVPPCGQLEPADPRRDARPVNAPFLVAEQLALEQPRRASRRSCTSRTACARPSAQSWIARATSSLPVPVSPQIKTVASVGATSLI